MVRRGYTVVPGGCKELQRVTSGLLGVSGGYKRLQLIPRNYRRLRIDTKVNRWLQKFTGCSKRITGRFKRLGMFQKG